MKALGKYFTYNEMIATNSGLLNIPNSEQEANLIQLIKHVLDPLRDLYGNPIKVNSAFRSTLVNKHVKGAATSQHCKGMAADLDCGDNAKLFGIIRRELNGFDQLIWEGGDNKQPAWVHVSFNTNGNRNEILRMSNGKYTKI